MEARYLKLKLKHIKEECDTILEWFTDNDKERAIEYCQDQINTFQLLIKKLEED